MRRVTDIVEPLQTAFDKSSGSIAVGFGTRDANIRMRVARYHEYPDGFGDRNFEHRLPFRRTQRR